MWCWRRMKKIKCPEKVTKETVLEWIGHVLRRNCPVHDGIEKQVTEVKGVGRRTQLLDDLRNRRRYWELKEEAKDRKR